MSRQNSYIYIFPPFVQFNKSFVAGFELLSINDTIHLYTTLNSNFIDVLSPLSQSAPVVFCFDNKDKEILPEKFLTGNVSLYFGDTNDKTSYLKKLANKYSHTSGNNLIIFANAIGITQQVIQRAFNLLAIDDESLVIGKATRERIAFIGFNSFNYDLFLDINWSNFYYKDFLSTVSKHDNFIHVLENFMLIEDKEDFKHLYDELSKKDSLAYCSQQMHERFTHLFIEYKELLK